MHLMILYMFQMLLLHGPVGTKSSSLSFPDDEQSFRPNAITRHIKIKTYNFSLLYVHVYLIILVLITIKTMIHGLVHMLF